MDTHVFWIAKVKQQFLELLINMGLRKEVMIPYMASNFFKANLVAGATFLNEPELLKFLIKKDKKAILYGSDLFIAKDSRQFISICEEYNDMTPTDYTPLMVGIVAISFQTL